MKHAAFYSGYVWAALGAALGVGFPLAAYLTLVTGLGFPVGVGFVSFIQTHGHVQLAGWAGLFVMGISLHFIPRLAGVPIARPRWRPGILWLMIVGLAVRSIGQSVMPYLSGFQGQVAVAWCLVASGLLEWLGILGYVGMLLGLFRASRNAGQRPALRAVRPYFGMMVCGWVLYACVNLALLVHMALANATVVHRAWNQWAVESFVGLVLLPVAFAFSLRLLPLFLRLPAVDWPVQGFAYAYLIGLLGYILPSMPALLRLSPQVLSTIASAGSILRACVILGLVWQLDVLTRRRAPWTVNRELHPGPERRPTRQGLPDYGEFGCFERLVYAAYIWLVAAALYEAIAALVTLFGGTFPWRGRAVLHLYVLGFITQLIFGMAVRMLPGFFQKRRVASARLVEATFWLGNAAVLGRVLWFIIPAGLFSWWPASQVGLRWAYAFSGLLGLAAVWGFAVNLWATSRLE